MKFLEMFFDGCYLSLVSCDMLNKISEQRTWYEAEKCRKPKYLLVGLPEFWAILYETEKLVRWDMTEDYAHYHKFEIFGMELKLVSVDKYFEVK